MQRLTLSAVFILGATRGTLALPPAYRFIDLGPGLPHDINNAGQIVGTMQYGTHWYDWQATLWENGGSTRIASSGNGSVAYGINSHGYAVGSMELGGGVVRSFLWDTNTTVDLNIGSGNADSHAYAINDDGAIVGDREGIYAYVLHGATYTELPCVGWSRAHDINESGQIVGYDSTPSTYIARAALWEGGNEIPLPGLTNGHTMAYAVNNRSQAVGYSVGSDGYPHAVLWESGVLTDLGVFGGDSCHGADINGMDQVVGTYRTTSRDWRAFVWEAGQMHDLASMTVGAEGFAIEGAFAINDLGQIVCRADNISSGVPHVGLLDPIPEPVVTGLLGAGVWMVLRRRKGQPGLCQALGR